MLKNSVGKVRKVTNQNQMRNEWHRQAHKTPNVINAQSLPLVPLADGHPHRAAAAPEPDHPDDHLIDPHLTDHRPTDHPSAATDHHVAAITRIEGRGQGHRGVRDPQQQQQRQRQVPLILID